MCKASQARRDECALKLQKLNVLVAMLKIDDLVVLWSTSAARREKFVFDLLGFIRDSLMEEIKCVQADVAFKAR